MLTSHRRRAGAAVLIPPTQPLNLRLSWPTDSSLVRQLYQVLHPDEEFSSIGKKAPEIVLFTDRSALIVSRAVLAFYNELGIEPPQVGPINADRAKEEGFAHSQTTSSDVANHEIERLAPVIAHRHVTIVEQYVASGRTLRYAAHLAHKAGAQTVTAIRGLWYEEVNPEDAYLDPPEVRRSADFMKGVGEQAAKIYKETYFS